MLRCVTTPAGVLRYELTHKRVKNLNLRIGPDGTVRLSAPFGLTGAQADAFVAARADWIAAVKQRAAARPLSLLEGPCPYTNEACEAALGPYIRRYAALFAGRFGGGLPVIKYRAMKSRWGVCYPERGQITLNRWLLAMPAAAQEYVVAHEFVHFLHPDHSAGFYAALAAILPDHKERRALLERLPADK